MAMLRSTCSGQCFPLEGELTILGRHPDCDIVLESGPVSRQHARIIRVETEYFVEDLHSRNGTLVNGQPVVGRWPLAENDELSICELQFLFQASPFLVGSAEPDVDACAGSTAGSTAGALLVDDSESAVLSKLSVSTGPSSFRLEVNAEVKLKALVEIGKNLGKALGLAEVLPRLLGSLFAIFPQADRGFVVLKDRETGKLVPEAVRYRREQEENETIRISRTIVDNVMKTGEAILSADAAADSRFDMSESIVDFQIRSMMCSPLIDSEGNTLGIIQIDSLDKRSRFDPEDLDVLASVACQAAYAVENAQLHEASVREQALARELAFAREIQRGFLPASQPQLDNYDFFEFYESASQLGGDYYDYIALPDGRLAIVVADVSGKGITASLLMARLVAETRFCLASAPTPSEAVSRLNRVFCGSRWESRFITLVLCVLDPIEHRVMIVNAGHLPPLLRREGAAVSEIATQETRLPLGVDEDASYPEHDLQLAAGDCLVLCSDGITEAMNLKGELYGRQRFENRLAETDAQTVGLGQAVLDDVKRFVGRRNQSDDMCLVCFGRETTSDMLDESRPTG